MNMAIPFLKNLLPGVKLVYTIFPVIFILLTHNRPDDIIKAFKLSFVKTGGSKKELEKAISLFTSMQHILITLILIGVPVLFIWLLASPQESPARIAHIVAILIGAFLYPLLFILFICIPFKGALQNKLTELE
jgi:hypothetical protein